MNLTEAVIKRWQLTLVLFLLLVMLGYSSFKSIPRSVDPHFPIPVVMVLAAQPGADAVDMEETVAKPIEEVIQSLDNIKEISSTNQDGSTVIVAQFDWSSDPEQAFDNVVREINAIRDDLPSGLARLEFNKMRTADSAVLQLALVSETASWRRMQKYADDMSDRLTRYEGVHKTIIHGLPKPQVSVSIDAGRLAELKMPPTVIADALRQGGAELAAGSVQSGGRRFNVDAGGAFRNLSSVRELPIRAGSGSLLTIDDVADVEWAAAEQLYRARHNGKRAVFITADQKNGTDTIRLRDELFKEVEQQREYLPEDITLELEFDQSRDIKSKLNVLARDFGIALVLVIFTLLPLGPRASIIVMISIPLSLASGLIALHATGFSLNQLSVAGFIVSLGLLVDDSIVVTENISRHLRKGARRSVAAIEGTKEITPAVLGSTGVLLFAFMPLLFLPGGGGLFSRSFILSIMFTVSASLIISLTIIPFLASRLLKRSDDPEGNAVMKWLTGNIDRFYKPLLHTALNKPRRTFWGAMALTFSAFFLLTTIGFSLFPFADTPYFRVTVETEQGASLDQTDSVVQKVIEVLKEEPEIVIRSENVGSAAPQIFYNVRPTNTQTNYAEVAAFMEKWNPKTSNDMVGRIREKLKDIPGARIKVVLFINGAPVAAPVAFRITGKEMPKLKELAAQVAKVLEDTPGSRDVDNPLATDRIDLDLGLDEKKAALLNIPGGAPRRAIRLALNGENAGTFRDEEGDSYPVVVRLPRDEHQPVSALDDIYVATRTGQSVPLSQITEPKLVNVPPLIQRYQLSRSTTVSAQVERGALATKVNQEALAAIEKLDFPDGYAVVVGGEAEAVEETFGGLGPILLMALFGIFAVLVAEFGRFRETIVVAGVIPLGTFGGIMALFITGYSVSFMAIIGFVALIGVEIKNSILLVDFTTQLRERGMGLREAIEEAGDVRFLPVLLTSVTAVGGLMPLAVGGGTLYAPLAWVMIGGLVSSTFLSRIVTPVMYLLIVRRVEEDEDKTNLATAI